MIYTDVVSLVTERDGIHEITSGVEEAVRKSGITNGICVVEAAHTTAGLLKICSCAEGTAADLVKEMRRLIPSRINFVHQDSPDDAAGHLKSAMFGTSLSLIVKDGKLVCLENQGIYFAEYDGPRNRHYTVCVFGE